MKQVLSFTAGAVFGILLMLVLPVHDQIPSTTPASSKESSPKQVISGKEPIEDARTDQGVGDSAKLPVNVSGSPQGNKVEAARLPILYQEMIGSIRPRRPSFPERHAEFVREPRDEPWAVAMETGLADYFAKRAPGLGVVIESIECRSENCEVAGYMIEGSQDNTGQIYELTGQPWWQGGSAISVHEFNSNGTEHFVMVTFRD